MEHSSSKESSINTQTLHWLQQHKSRQYYLRTAWHVQANEQRPLNMEAQVWV